jgi:signal transduction histidine kinase
VSLRLRILLLIAAVNVGLLLLLLAVGLLAGPPGRVSVAALREAQRAAADPSFDVSTSRYLSYTVRLPRGGDRVIVRGPRKLEEKLRRKGEELLRRADREGSAVEQDEEGLTILYPSPGGGSDRAVYIGFREAARQEALEELRNVYLVLCAGTVLLILVTFLLLNRVVLRPLNRLAEASTQIALGRHAEPVPRSGRNDEMDRLVATFNHMVAEVHEYQQHLEARVLDALNRAKAAEGRLVVAQRLAATGTLAAGIAHEINNPLGGIANAVRRLRAGDLSTKKKREYLDLIWDGVDRIRVIVERVLDFTPREGEPRAVDAADVCRRAADLALHRAEPRGVRLEIDAEGTVLGAVGDPQELCHAVLNLVLNAIDAIPEGRGGTVEVRARREAQDVVLEVVDDGVGMDDETLRRCVDLFYSTKEAGEGSGLGLSIVQHIVTDHGGALEIDSGRDRGTRVRIRLPVAAEGTAAGL